MPSKKSRLLLTVMSVILLGVIPLWAQHNLNPYELRIFRLILINVVLGEAINLVTGIGGMVVLSHPGFALIGAYVYALSATSQSAKLDAWILTPPIWPFSDWPFQLCIVCGALLAGVLGLLVGMPALRLRGGYLTIATLAFSEIAMLMAFNLVGITNGPLGVKAVPDDLNVWWMWALAILTVVFVYRLSRSAFGRALKCIRQDDRVAEVLGVNLFYHKAICFSIAAGLDGVAGAMIASLFSSVDPMQFAYGTGFIVLVMVILGGLGSVSGTVIGVTAVTLFLEWARFLDQPMRIGGVWLPRMPGLRYIVLAVVLIATITSFSRGLMGTDEFSFDLLWSRLNRTAVRFQGRFCALMKGRGSSGRKL